jgi:hypothetical protein
VVSLIGQIDLREEIDCAANDNQVSAKDIPSGDTIVMSVAKFDWHRAANLLSDVWQFQSM